MNEEYNLWADGLYPYDRASCGACLSEHESELCCQDAGHEALRLAAKEAELVKMVGQMRKTDYGPKIASIHATFLKLRKKYRRFWAVSTILLFAFPLQAQEVKLPRFDSGWLARAHWTATAFDYATTGNANHSCHAQFGDDPGCHETNPLSWPFIGHHNTPSWRLGIAWAGESAAVSFIPNRKVRRITQIGLIGSHVFFGVRNLRRWH